MATRENTDLKTLADLIYDKLQGLPQNKSIWEQARGEDHPNYGLDEDDTDYDVEAGEAIDDAAILADELTEMADPADLLKLAFANLEECEFVDTDVNIQTVRLACKKFMEEKGFEDWTIFIHEYKEKTDNGGMLNLYEHVFESVEAGIH